MRVAAAAFAAAAIFLAGVLVGVGAGEEPGREVPVAIALVDRAEGTPQPTDGQGPSGGKQVEHRVEHGEADDHGGHGEVEYEDEGYDDNSGSGSDDSGSDDSASGSDDSGSGSDNSGSGSDDSGSGSDDSGSGSDNSGSGSDNSGSGSDDSGG